MTSATGAMVLAKANLHELLTLRALVCAGSLLVLYAPTAWSLATTLWATDAHSHGPVVLGLSIWLFVRGISAHVREGALSQPRPVLGWALLTIGLLIYALGHSQAIYLLEVGSSLPVVMGSVLIISGPALARRLWFAFVFLLFLVPLPVSLIDSITQPMKIAVSWAAEHLMYAMGYPVGRSGVVLGIGHYQLFVADACAGLNSLFMLEAFGLLYLNVVRHESVVRNAALAVLIVPISFASNVVRVLVLALVTYHLGDEAGQGFIHTFSGMVLFVVALLLTILADAGMRAVSRMRPWRQHTLFDSHAPGSEPYSAPRTAAPVQHWRAVGVLGAATAASAVAWAIAPPPPAVRTPFDLEASIPSQFGDWKRVDLPNATVEVVPQGEERKSLNRPYDSAVLRAYANSRGERVALAVAYATDQRQETKIHRPEVCYAAAGYLLLEQSSIDLLAGSWPVGTGLPGRRLLAQSAQHREVVSYWMRIGPAFPQSGWAFRKALFVNAWNGRSSDGVLVRASSQLAPGAPVEAGHALNERFLADLVTALPHLAQNLLVGALLVSPAS